MSYRQLTAHKKHGTQSPAPHVTLLIHAFRKPTEICFNQFSARFLKQIHAVTIAVSVLKLVPFAHSLNRTALIVCNLGQSIGA